MCVQIEKFTLDVCVCVCVCVYVVCMRDDVHSYASKVLVFIPLSIGPGLILFTASVVI